MSMQTKPQTKGLYSHKTCRVLRLFFLLSSLILLPEPSIAVTIVGIWDWRRQMEPMGLLTMEADTCSSWEATLTQHLGTLMSTPTWKHGCRPQGAGHPLPPYLHHAGVLTFDTVLHAEGTPLYVLSHSPLFNRKSDRRDIWGSLESTSCWGADVLSALCTGPGPGCHTHIRFKSTNLKQMSSPLVLFR